MKDKSLLWCFFSLFNMAPCFGNKPLAEAEGTLNVTKSHVSYHTKDA